MAELKNIPIGEVLKQEGYITEEQLQTALQLQKSTEPRQRLGDVLIGQGYVTEGQMLAALSRRFDLPTVDINATPVQREAVEKIPQQLAKRYQILAVKAEGNVLTVATNDPLNLYAFEDIRQMTHMELRIMLAERQPLRRAIDYQYSDLGARKAAVTANSESSEVTAEVIRDVAETDSAEDAPIIRLLDSLLQRAIATGASDIHIEPFENETVVRLRVDGVILPYLTLQSAVHGQLIARIKIVSNLDIAEKRLPQDGHFRVGYGERRINIRVSLIPTEFGEKAVMRVLAGAGQVDYADHFGMNDADYAQFAPMLEAPNGIIYITGPTGSGKTTTLYMVMETLRHRSINIATIEDPVETHIAGIAQTQVNLTAGMTFEVGLRALLRQDPDVIMVGETRDAETASISVRSAITGHTVYSTLHTNDASSAVARLADMGVERYLIANSLVGVVAQRLVRKVCPHCAATRAVTPAEQGFLGPDVLTVRYGRGCTQCNNTGYRGRIAIHEILTIDHELRKMITAGASSDEIREYAETHRGMKVLARQARQLVLDGVTTPQEYIKVASIIE